MSEKLIRKAEEYALERVREQNSWPHTPEFLKTEEAQLTLAKEIKTVFLAGVLAAIKERLEELRGEQE